MNAGLPTTGIGGIFYFISVVVMVFSEIYITLRGKSSLKRWKFVLGQVFLVLAIIGASVSTAYLLTKAVPASIRSSISSISGVSGNGFQASEKIVFIPFIILGVLLVITQLLRAYFVIRKRLRN